MTNHEADGGDEPLGASGALADAAQRYLDLWDRNLADWAREGHNEGTPPDVREPADS